MHLILAENLNGWLAAAAGFFAAMLASVVALVALVPASRGNRSATLAMAGPAFVIGVLITLATCYGYVRDGLHNPDYELRDFLVPWLMFAGPPLATSALAISVLWLRRVPRAP